MDSKTIAVIAIFTALSVVLVLSPFKIPAPYAPFLKYQIWEIPIATAFLVYGPLIGTAIAVMNTTILLAVYPGDLPTGPLYNLAAVLSMLLGVYIVHRFAQYTSRGREAALIVLSSTLSAVLRVGFMSIVNWTFIRYPPPIGFGIPEEAIIPLLPLIGLFNATVVLYTIPIGYFLARAVSSGTRIPLWATMKQH